MIVLLSFLVLDQAVLPLRIYSQTFLSSFSAPLTSVRFVLHSESPGCLYMHMKGIFRLSFLLCRTHHYYFITYISSSGTNTTYWYIAGNATIFCWPLFTKRTTMFSTAWIHSDKNNILNSYFSTKENEKQTIKLKDVS